MHATRRSAFTCQKCHRTYPGKPPADACCTPQAQPERAFGAADPRLLRLRLQMFTEEVHTEAPEVVDSIARQLVDDLIELIERHS
jgi:hypothetical protein